MITNSLLALSTVILLSLSPSHSIKPREVLLSEHKISFEQRQPDPWVNSVFRFNILRNVSLMGYSFTLNPSETFAFHEDTLPKYTNVVKTSNAHFNLSEGFKSDGYLVGDGVCHLASLMYWTAKDAGLDTFAPANHNFARIPEISKEYGVSIYYYPGKAVSNTRQNLYVTNNFEESVTFKFFLEQDNLKLSIVK